MKTYFYDKHLSLGAKMGEYGGFDVPLHYGKGAVEEHLAVRKAVGLFDHSSLGVIGVKGQEAEQLLDYLSTNSLTGRADYSITYTTWCNITGGCVDDVLVFRRNGDHFWVVTNAMTRSKDLAHLQEYARAMKVEIEARFDQAVLGLQGPHSPLLLSFFFPECARLQYMHFLETRYRGEEIVLSRTGYTGSVGFEIYGSPAALAPLYDELLREGAAYGIEPAGYYARDSLRLEMGYALYGCELAETVAPTETVSSWTVKWSKPDFLGKEALVMLESNPEKRVQQGVVLKGKALARTGAEVLLGEQAIGQVTSGGYSPILQQGLALIMVDRPLPLGERLTIPVRHHSIEAEVVELPFVPIDCKQIERVVKDRKIWMHGEKTVYIAASQASQKELMEQWKQAAVARGYKLLNDDPWALCRASVDAVRTEEIELQKIDEAAYVIVDCSAEDTGIGRVIEYGKTKGLMGKRPARLLCVYKQEQETRLSPFVKAMGSGKYPHVHVAAYDQTGDTLSVVARFLDQPYS